MEAAYKITVYAWGVRGSFPMTGACFNEFGGNTSCISVDFGNELLIFDGGSGIIHLNSFLENFRKPEKIHILISHLHLDHIQGLLGFSPLYERDARIYLYGAKRADSGFEESLSSVLTPPYWPVGIEDFKNNLTICEFNPGENFNIGNNISVRTAQSNHPNESVMYRVEKNGKSIVYTLDCEYTEEFAPSLHSFAKDCDLLIWDSNFTEDDLIEGWGHSTWKQGVETAKTAGADKIMMTHFNQNYTDEFLKEQEKLAVEEYPNCIFAREGKEIKL